MPKMVNAALQGTGTTIVSAVPTLTGTKTEIR